MAGVVVNNLDTSGAFDAGDDRAFRAILFGRKSDEVMNILRREVEYAKGLGTRLGDIGKRFSQNVERSFEYYNGDDVRDRLDRVRREYQRFVERDVDLYDPQAYQRLVKDIDMFHLPYSSTYFQRLALAQPKFLKRYLNDEVVGFKTPIELEETHIHPEFRTDYMRVYDGLIQEVSEEDGEYIVHEHFSFEDDEEEMDMTARCVAFHLHASIDIALDLGIDPTEIYTEEEIANFRGRLDS